MMAMLALLLSFSLMASSVSNSTDCPECEYPLNMNAIQEEMVEHTLVSTPDYLDLFAEIRDTFISLKWAVNTLNPKIVLGYRVSIIGSHKDASGNITGYHFESLPLHPQVTRFNLTSLQPNNIYEICINLQYNAIESIIRDSKCFNLSTSFALPCLPGRDELRMLPAEENFCDERCEKYSPLMIAFVVCCVLLSANVFMFTLILGQCTRLRGLLKNQTERNWVPDYDESTATIARSGYILKVPRMAGIPSMSFLNKNGVLNQPENGLSSSTRSTMLSDHNEKEENGKSKF